MDAAITKQALPPASAIVKCGAAELVFLHYT